MLNVTYEKTRDENEGRYYVELVNHTPFLGATNEKICRFGYWCDKPHLKHMIVALLAQFNHCEMFYKILGEDNMKWHKDKVHNPISSDLAKAGCAVLDLSKLGRGAPDALSIRGTITRIFEYKSDRSVNHRKKGQLFTPDQLAWQRKNPRLMQYYRVVETSEQALREMGF